MFGNNYFDSFLHSDVMRITCNYSGINQSTHKPRNKLLGYTVAITCKYKPIYQMDKEQGSHVTQTQVTNTTIQAEPRDSRYD